MSNNNSSSSSSGGAGLLSLLTVLFVGLKLTGYITWSWWWVASPILFGIGSVVLFLGAVLGIALVSGS